MSDEHANVEKYAKAPVHEAALKGLAKIYRLVLHNMDTRYVACSDAAERDRVRDSFLKKKLGLDSDDLDDVIVSVCQKRKGDRLKSRLTFYYLLAEHYGRLDEFA
jgi:hypothetical protein